MVHAYTSQRYAWHNVQTNHGSIITFQIAEKKPFETFYSCIGARWAWMLENHPTPPLTNAASGQSGGPTKVAFSSKRRAPQVASHVVVASPASCLKRSRILANHHYPSLWSIRSECYMSIPARQWCIPSAHPLVIFRQIKKLSYPWIGPFSQTSFSHTARKGDAAGRSQCAVNMTGKTTMIDEGPGWNSLIRTAA